MTSTYGVFDKDIDLCWVHPEVELIENGEKEEQRPNAEQLNVVTVFFH